MPTIRHEVELDLNDVLSDVDVEKVLECYTADEVLGKLDWSEVSSDEVIETLDWSSVDMDSVLENQINWGRVDMDAHAENLGHSVIRTVEDAKAFCKIVMEHAVAVAQAKIQAEATAAALKLEADAQPWTGFSGQPRPS